MFPYSGKSNFTESSDPAIAELQQAHQLVEDVVLASVFPDPNVKMIAHFDKSLNGHKGQEGVGSGAIRYFRGRYDGGFGVLVEQSGANLVPNPSAEVDLTGWSASDASVALSRDTSRTYNLDNTVSAASFKVAGTGNAGRSYVKSSVAVSTNTAYSASVYVYAPAGAATKAKLQLSFSGGALEEYDSGDVALTADGWTRIRLDDKNSSNNTLCEIRVYLTQQAPAFEAGSRLSTIDAPTHGLVTDSTSLSTGDVIICATSANPASPAYSYHMVTTGAAVNSANLRLDNQASAPTFVPASRYAKFPSTTAVSVSSATALAAGDLVFCNLGSGYDWHIVTTAANANSTDLRLDDMPSSPSFSGTHLAHLVPTDQDTVTGTMTIDAGDIVFCRTLANPASTGYRWHMVTTGATAVNSADLRLDDSSFAPVFATGSYFAKLAPSATGLDNDTTADLDLGALAFAYTTKNPAKAGYAWHLVTAGTTDGVADSILRLDQATSEIIFVDAVQLEQRIAASSYIDSYQGTGFGGSVAGSSTRSSSTLAFPTTGLFTGQNGVVAFSIFPLWSGDDSRERVLFDMAYGEEQDRVRFVKNAQNKLALGVYDNNGQLKQIVSNSTVSFAREEWTHLAFSWNNGTLAMYLNGAAVVTSTEGSGSGQLTNLASHFYLGTTYNGVVSAGTVFDDLVVGGTSISADQIAKMAVDQGPFLGLAGARKGIDSGFGNATTHGTPGTETTIAHNLGVAPQFIQITPRGNGVVYLSQSPDATSFFVKGSAASINFDWRAII